MDGLKPCPFCGAAVVETRGALNVPFYFYKWMGKKQTNADRIRAMSDEELAEWIALLALKLTKNILTNKKNGLPLMRRK